MNTHWKVWRQSWNSNTLATWCKVLTPWKRPWCWERLKAGGEGDDREWDGWMESPTWWTWVWVSSRSWWWTGKPSVLQSMELQRLRHDWMIELSWTEPKETWCAAFMGSQRVRHDWGTELNWTESPDHGACPKESPSHSLMFFSLPWREQLEGPANWEKSG